MKTDKDVRTNNTDNYRKLGLVIQVLALIAGLAVCFEYSLLYGIYIIVTGCSLNILLQIAHSICHRLDLIIDKK